MSSPGRYIHDALIYGSDEELLAVAVPFLRGGLDADEVVVVHAAEQTLALLGAALNHEARIAFRPLGERYSHPARAISAYQRFIERGMAAGARGFRALGEIAYAGDPEQRTEWARYEAVVNHALAPFPIWGLCPYDTRRVPEEIVAAARLTHPNLVTGSDRSANPAYVEPADFVRRSSMIAGPSPIEATTPLLDVDDVDDLPTLRRTLTRAVTTTALPAETAHDFVIAVGEVVTNAIMHGLPPVRVRVWARDQRLLCTVTDRGPGLDDPLAGYESPHRWHPSRRSGMGLWVARQLCDQLSYGVTPTEAFTVRLAIGPPGDS